MKYLLSLLIVLSIVGCAEGFSPSELVYNESDAGVLVDANIENTSVSVCDHFVYYPIEYSTEGTYVSERGDVYRVSMHFENLEDANPIGMYTAKDIGMAANAVVETWQENGLDNPEAVRSYLSNFHVIVLHMNPSSTDNDFARLYKPEDFMVDPGAVLQESSSVGAYVYFAGSKCFPDIPPNANFFIVLRYYQLRAFGSAVIIHELLHPACYVGIGSSQHYHDDSRIWNHLGYSENVLDKAHTTFLWDYFVTLSEL